MANAKISPSGPIVATAKAGVIQNAAKKNSES